MRNVFLLIVLVTIIGCDSPPHKASSTSDTDTTSYSRSTINLELFPGSLNNNDQFTEVELPLTVTPAYDLVPVQVGAIVLELNGHNPDFLRIEFSSDRVEWVGYSQNSIEIYDSEEACLESEDHCDEVIVGEGSSGYFEIDSGHIAIQNAYCRYANDSYNFTITAIAYNLSDWPIVAISNSTDIMISCHMIDQ
jgi:hypothetical protein